MVRSDVRMSRRAIPQGTNLSLGKAWRGCIPILHVTNLVSFQKSYPKWITYHEDDAYVFEFEGSFVSPTTLLQMADEEPYVEPYVEEEEPIRRRNPARSARPNNMAEVSYRQRRQRPTVQPSRDGDCFYHQRKRCRKQHSPQRSPCI